MPTLFDLQLSSVWLQKQARAQHKKENEVPKSTQPSLAPQQHIPKPVKPIDQDWAQRELEGTISVFTKYYNDSELDEDVKIHYYQDSRIGIKFSREQLITLLELFATMQNEPYDHTSANQAPFFGTTESCFKAFLVYALMKQPAHSPIPETPRELQYSIFGKNLIVNLLHTANTSNWDDLRLNRATFQYTTNPEIKACYIKMFREACEEAVDIMQQKLPESSQLSF